MPHNATAAGMEGLSGASLYKYPVSHLTYTNVTVSSVITLSSLSVNTSHQSSHGPWDVSDGRK